MARRLYISICILYWQRSKLIISPGSANFEIWAPPPPTNSCHPWNTSRTRYLSELPGGCSKPPPTDNISIVLYGEHFLCSWYAEILSSGTHT